MQLLQVALEQPGLVALACAQASRAVLVLEISTEQERVLDRLVEIARTQAPRLVTTRETVARIALTYGLEQLERERLIEQRPRA